MTYAPTVAYLQAQALAAGCQSFWHGKQATQSINYNAPFPQADLLLFQANYDGQGNVDYQIGMYIYGQDALENSQEESVTVLDDIDRICQRFISRLANTEDSGFELNGPVQTQPLYREGSMVGTGHSVAFTLSAKAECWEE